MTRNEHTEISSELLAIEELEREAHQIWDHVEGNLMYGRLSKDMKEALHKQTSEAVRKHRESMDRLQAVRKRMSEIMRRDATSPALN